jgi:TGF-beta propeptide
MKIFTAMLIFITALNAQLVFHPTQDASVYQDDPNNNYGSIGKLSVYSNLFNTNSIKRTLMQFDLTGMAPGTSIVQAMLNVYMFDQAGTDFDVEIHPILQPWTEPGVTWNNQPACDTHAIASLPYQGYGWWHFNITPLTQLWVDNPSVNQGIMLKFAIEQYPDSLGRAAYFYSRDTTLEQPNLEVIFMGIEQRNAGRLAAGLILPNPVREHASLAVRIPDPGRYAIDLYDPSGKKVKAIHRGFLDAGGHSLLVDCRGFAAGVYLVILRSEETGEIQIAKLTIVK